MNCPDEIRKNCWSYRLNLGLECWRLRKKVREKSSWPNQRKCNTCEFFQIINLKFNVE